MIDNYIIVDDCIPKKYQDDIEELLLGNSGFPWYYVHDVTLTKDRIDRAKTEALCPAFNHVFYNEANPQFDQWFDFVRPLAYIACEKINFDLQEILQARSFLQTPNSKPIANNHAHIDLPFDHLVCLYYVTDNEAPTTLYKQTRYDTKMEDIATVEFEPLDTVMPKKGRCLFFNGKHYHSSSSPSTTTRTIINFDLV